MDIVKEIGEFLRKPLPLEDLESHIIGLDALRFELSESRVNSMKILYEKRKQMLWPKDTIEKLTELDRTTRLNGDVATLERDYQFLQRLETLVDERIKLALTLLNS